MKRVFNFFKIPEHEEDYYSLEALHESYIDPLKLKYPIRYFINFTIPDFYLGIKDKIRSVSYWFRYRTTQRYHIIKLHGLSPGWYDTDTRILYSCFNLLNDFVEIELSHMFTYTRDQIKWRKKSSKKLGLKYLQEIIDSPESRAIDIHSANEQKELYLWWENRRDRLDPWNSIEIWGKDKNINFLQNIESANKYRINSEKAEKLEKFYKDEDNAQLLRLIKIKDELWI